MRNENQANTNKKGFSAERITRIAIVAAVYVAVTLAIAPIAFSQVQFRISEILVLLCFYNKDYCYSLSIGCFIANFASPTPVFDVPIGTLATIIAVILIARSSNLLIASIFPVVANGLIVGAMLSMIYKLPFFITVAGVAFGELVVVTIAGTVIFKILEKNKMFIKLIGANQNIALAK